MNKTIIRFLQQQSCASICCTDGQAKPYCFSCFYVFNEAEGLFYFKSSVNSQHSALLKINPFIAGTVLPDKLNNLVIKGIQFTGIVLDAEQPLTKGATSKYLAQHPIASAIPGEIWVIRIDEIKMTDQTLGFGKKITWKRAEKLEEINVV